MSQTMNPVVISAARARASQIRAEIAEIEARRIALLAEVEQLENAIEAVGQSGEAQNADISACICQESPQPETPSRTVEPAEEPTGRRRYMNMARAVDYQGARNQIDEVVCVAVATADGILNTTHVAEILLRDGRSVSQKGHLRGTVQGILKRHDDFKKIAAGTFKYLKWGGEADDGERLNGVVQLEPPM